jgi:hypothetical protein
VGVKLERLGRSRQGLAEDVVDERPECAQSDAGSATDEDGCPSANVRAAVSGEQAATAGPGDVAQDTVEGV